MYAPPLFTTIRSIPNNENVLKLKNLGFNQHNQFKDLFYQKIDTANDTERIKKSPDLNLGNTCVDVFCTQAVLRGADVFAVGVLSLPKFVKIGEHLNLYGILTGKNPLRGIFFRILNVLPLLRSVHCPYCKKYDAPR